MAGRASLQWMLDACRRLVAASAGAGGDGAHRADPAEPVRSRPGRDRRAGERRRGDGGSARRRAGRHPLRHPGESGAVRPDGRRAAELRRGRGRGDVRAPDDLSRDAHPQRRPDDGRTPPRAGHDERQHAGGAVDAHDESRRRRQHDGPGRADRGRRPLHAGRSHGSGRARRTFRPGNAVRSIRLPGGATARHRSVRGPDDGAVGGSRRPDVPAARDLRPGRLRATRLGRHPGHPACDQRWRRARDRLSAGRARGARPEGLHRTERRRSRGARRPHAPPEQPGLLPDGRPHRGRDATAGHVRVGSRRGRLRGGRVRVAGEPRVPRQPARHALPFSLTLAHLRAADGSGSVAQRMLRMAGRPTCCLGVGLALLSAPLETARRRRRDGGAEEALMRKDLGAVGFLLSGIAAGSAHAHGVVGERAFIEPFIAEDVNPKNEFVIGRPEWDHSRDGRTLSLGFGLEKKISDRFSLTLDSAWLDITPRPAAEPHASGFDNLGITLKYAFFIDPVHEAIASVALESSAPTGTEKVGAEQNAAFKPFLLYGKGANELPDALRYLRPLAVQGDAGFEIAIDRARTTALAHNVAVEYSIPYLQQAVRDFALPWPLSNCTADTEFNFEHGVNGEEHGRSKVFTTPGFVYMDRFVELGMAGRFPLNQAAHDELDWGIVWIFDLFIDDIFPWTKWQPL